MSDTTLTQTHPASEPREGETATACHPCEGCGLPIEMGIWCNSCVLHGRTHSARKAELVPTPGILFRDLTPEEEDAMRADLVNRNAAQRLADANAGLMSECMLLRRVNAMLQRERRFWRFTMGLAFAFFLARILELFQR